MSEILRLPRKMAFHTQRYTTDLHQILPLPRKNDTLTMSHACRVICALPPLDAALTKKNTQHDTSKVLRLAGGLIGTYTESGGRLRTVANGCGWLLTVNACEQATHWRKTRYNLVSHHHASPRIHRRSKCS